MVVEIMRDEVCSMIEVRHLKSKDEIEAFNVDPEVVHKAEIDAVKNELLEDYPDYSLNFATRNKDYEPFGRLGLVMWYVVRGVKYFNL